MLLCFMAMIGIQPDLSENKNSIDEGLILNMAQGDTDALALFYAKTKTSVYAFALSLLRNAQDAEDVMQDVYVKIFAASATYQAQGKPMAWTLTIVRRFALMKMRERKKAEPLSDEAWALPGEGDFTEASIDQMVLHKAMTILSDEERQIVILHSVSGLKHREIAGILDLPLSTVLSKYHRALSKLKKRMKEGQNEGKCYSN